MFLRFFVTVGFLLAMGAALGSFSIFSSYQVERQQRLGAESKMVQNQDALIAAKYEVEQQQARLADLSAQVNLLKKSEMDLKTQNSSLVSEVQSAKDELAAKTAELKKIREQIETQKKKDLVAGLTPDVPVISSAPVTPVTIASPASVVIPAEAPASDDSRVLTVNRKHNFVVVNLGLRDGLRMGDKIEVVQGTTQKALAQIEKIYDKFSAATLLNEDKGNPVHEGDAVRKI